MRIFAVIFLFLFLPQISWCLDLSRQTSFDERDACEIKNKAIWREFGNSCGDGCEMQFDEFKICDNSLVVACDCGEKRCWNGKACVTNSSYKKIYNKKVKERQEKIAKEKETRAKEADAERQRILKKLISDSQARAMSIDIEGAANNYMDAYREDFESLKNSQIVQDASNAIANGNQNIQNAANNLDKKTIIEAPPIVIDNSNAKVPPAFIEQEKARQNNSNAGTNSPPSLPVIPLPK